MPSSPCLEPSRELRSLHHQQCCVDMQLQVTEQQTLVQLTQETHWPVYCKTWQGSGSLYPSTHTHITHTQTLLGPLYSMLQEGEASSSSDRWQGALALLGLLVGKVCSGVNPDLFCLDIWFVVTTQMIRKRQSMDDKNRLSHSNTVAQECLILWTLDKILHG